MYSDPIFAMSHMIIDELEERNIIKRLIFLAKILSLTKIR
jgi:hypothetical protein